MDSDEDQIYFYLRRWQHQYHSPGEICRLAGGRRQFVRDPHWARPVLARMVHRGIVEMDADGHFRLKPAPEIKPPAKPIKTQRWISPHIREMLLHSGKDFSAVLGSQGELHTHAHCP